MDAITYDLFSGCTTVSEQLRSWVSLRGNKSVPPHAFPELFMECQERALAGLNERASELEHLLVKSAAMSGPQRFMFRFGRLWHASWFGFCRASCECSQTRFT